MRSCVAAAAATMTAEEEEEQGRGRERSGDLHATTKAVHRLWRGGDGDGDVTETERVERERQKRGPIVLGLTLALPTPATSQSQAFAPQETCFPALLGTGECFLSSHLLGGGGGLRRNRWSDTNNQRASIAGDRHERALPAATSMCVTSMLLSPRIPSPTGQIACATAKDSTYVH